MPTVWTIYWSFPAIICHLAIATWKMPVSQKGDDKNSGCSNIFVLREWEFWSALLQLVSLPLLLGMKGKGPSCQILGADEGPWDSGLAAGLFPSLPSPGASWLTGIELVSQDRCLSSGLHVVTVGNYDLFQKEFAINLSWRRGGRKIRQFRIKKKKTLEGIWLMDF